MKKISYDTYEKPSDFIKFAQGDTTIRIISSGGLTKKHGMRTGSGYVPLGDCTETAACKFCLQGNEPKLKWIWICLVRPDNQVKLLDVGPQIGDAICKMAKQKKKDPQEYDLIINRVGEQRSTKYTVKMGKVEPITPKEVTEAKPTKAFLINKYFMQDRMIPDGKEGGSNE